MSWLYNLFNVIFRFFVSAAVFRPELSKFQYKTFTSRFWSGVWFLFSIIQISSSEKMWSTRLSPDVYNAQAELESRSPGVFTIDLVVRVYPHVLHNNEVETKNGLLWEPHYHSIINVMTCREQSMDTERKPSLSQSSVTAQTTIPCPWQTRAK